MDICFDITSSWECENDKNLASVIKTVEKFSDNIVEVLSEDQCISFKEPAGSVECTITIQLIESKHNDLCTEKPGQLCNRDQESDCDMTIISDGEGNHDPHNLSSNNSNLNLKKGMMMISPQNHYLDKMIILSEARLIELYSSQYSEYITTVHGTLLSEFEDSKIYQTILLFDNLEKSVILKPKGLFCPDSLWIYGIFLKVKKTPEKAKFENGGTENPLEAILKEKNVVLSEKAEKFKKLLNVYTSFQSTNTYHPFIDPFSASSVFSNIHWAYTNSVDDRNLKFLYPKSVLTNSLKEETLQVKSNENQMGGILEKIFSKMQQILLEENDSKVVNGSHIKFLSKNGNSPVNHLTPNSGDFTEINENSSPHPNPEVKENEVDLDYQIPCKYQPLNEDTLAVIHTIIDKKLRQFEDHIVYKLETKITEVNKSITERLDKIENLLLNNLNSGLL